MLSGPCASSQEGGSWFSPPPSLSPGCPSPVPVPRGASSVGVANGPGTWASLGAHREAQGASLGTEPRAITRHPQQATWQHAFASWPACLQSLWQSCPNNPIGQKGKQLYTQEVFLKMPCISRRGEIWGLGCSELTCWPFILRGHWCLKTAQFLNETALGGLGLLRKEFFCCAENKGIRVHRHKQWIQSLCKAGEGALGQNRGTLMSLYQRKEMTNYLWVILVLTVIVMYGSIDLM